MGIEIPDYQTSDVKNSYQCGSNFPPHLRRQMRYKSIRLAFPYDYKTLGPIEDENQSITSLAIGDAVTGLILYDKNYAYVELDGQKPYVDNIIHFISQVTNLDNSAIEVEKLTQQNAPSDFSVIVL